MDADWITSSTARRILMHWADPRPAWLWSQDGARLLWRNDASRLFNAKNKKSGLKLTDGPVPIKGQVARLIRLGSVGRSSLSRVQFLAGGRPVATTCSCTPLLMLDGELALLMVGVDPVDNEIRELAGDLGTDDLALTLFPRSFTYTLARDGEQPGEGEIRLRAGPGDEVLILRGPATAVAPATIDEMSREEGVTADDSDAEPDLADTPEPMLPMGLSPLPAEPVAPDAEDHWIEPTAQDADRVALSSLFDRLADDSRLYEPLTAADDVFSPPANAAGDEATLTVVEAPPEPAAAETDISVDETAQEPETEVSETVPPVDADDKPAVAEISETPAPVAEGPKPRTHWMITGRGFRAPRPVARDEDVAPPEPADERSAPAALVSVPSTTELVAENADGVEPVDPVSRYNFEELGRILTDRVGGDVRQEPESSAPAPATPPNPIVSLNAETLVLNRLTLAILVFRDQQILFANRALLELLGHDSVESLRQAGIASVFPSDETAGAGPVNRLTSKDGSPLQVAARLQSVSWQGRAALMLSATPVEPQRGHEAAVATFAEISARARNEGFIRADRVGVVTQVSAVGREMLGDTELVGRPLSALIDRADLEPLRRFLDQPARFAETTRPSVVVTSTSPNVQITLFAEGQAGIVTGYFGFVSRRAAAAGHTNDEDLFDPGLLGRLSRGLRRPLNTIIGFADLLRTTKAAESPDDRTAEYARDIRTAGLEIAVLADELDDFTRLRDGRYAPRPADVDLAALLESCAVRVKAQASAARVLVRSAISEALPRIRADRASLGQALLNLLASAIDQTPIGGSVILSAQSEDDGSITVNVRDGSTSAIEIGERFVVFRDGIDKDGEQLAPVRSSVGLALTRSLLAVNACSLSVDPTMGTGTLFSLSIPAELVMRDGLPHVH